MCSHETTITTEISNIFIAPQSPLLSHQALSTLSHSGGNWGHVLLAPLLYTFDDFFLLWESPLFGAFAKGLFSRVFPLDQKFCVGWIPVTCN